MTHLAELTDKERETLNTMLSFVDRGERDKSRIYKLTAAKLKISVVTVKTRLSWLRSKYDRVLETARDYRGWQQKFYQRTGGKFNPLSRCGK
ncbi:MAG: hypothetical protein OEX01_03025 [Candidatus Bathyarchaeota archaeon]|nr:hypothetical protein [Candidatus Bathyarchaeota archaeon]